MMYAVVVKLLARDAPVRFAEVRAEARSARAVRRALTGKSIDVAAPDGVLRVRPAGYIIISVRPHVPGDRTDRKDATS